MKKKILVFSLAYYPVEGGAEIAVKEIISRFPEMDFDIVTLLFDKKHDLEESLGNSKIYRINTSKNLYPFKALLLAIKLHKTNNYAAVWGIMANWAGLAALFFKFRFPHIKYILTLQEGDPIPYIMNRTKFIGPLFRKIFQKADKIQAISNYLANWAKDMGGRDVVVIPNGVEVARFQNSANRIFNEKEVVLITTSRLVEKNAVGDIIEAMKFLPESFSLKIVGIGALERELKAQVESSDLASRVEFLGHVPYEDIPRHLHAADIFIRPSLSEGMGNSFIEAMAAGLPVIATPVGGIPDFLKDGETGLFVPPKSPRLIAFQVQKLANDKVLRDKITISAKRFVSENYDWDFVTKDMKSRVFDRVLIEG